MTTAIMAPSGVAMKARGRLRRPTSSSTLLKKPRPGKASNIHRQVSATMTVDVIQGSSISPRKKFRQRHVACRTRAIPSPVTILRATDDTVKTRLLRTTVRNASSLAQVDVVAQPDEALGVADELVGERQPDGAVDRVDDQTDDEHEEWQQQEYRGAGVRVAASCRGGLDTAPT